MYSGLGFIKRMGGKISVGKKKLSGKTSGDQTVAVQNIDSASVSVTTKITFFLIMLKNCHIFYVHESKDFYFS